MRIKWAYGVTTCPQRRKDLLPRTLASLSAAGFDKPRLFIDGAAGGTDWTSFGLGCTFRFPTIHTYGNWVLGLAELYVREPAADRYAMFQDDLVTCKNLRRYLDSVQYPEKGYWNLYTFPSNQSLAPGGGKTGWYHSNQFGRGAVALIFDRQTVLTLLTHQHMVERPMDAHRGWKTVDGGILTALQKAGWVEWVHDPSLVQHTGLASSMGNKPHKLAVSFPGEEWDASEMIR